jgi:hypothetical protein
LHEFLVFSAEELCSIVIIIIIIQSTKPILTAMGIRCADHATPSICLSSPRNGGPSVGIVCGLKPQSFIIINMGKNEGYITKVRKMLNISKNKV